MLLLSCFFLLFLTPRVGCPDQEDSARLDAESAALQQAIQLYDQGKLDEAKAAFEKVIAQNPSDLESRRYIKSIISIKRKMTHWDQNIMNRDRILDVRRAWVPVQRDSQAKAVDELARGKAPAGPSMQERVKQIIPEINFTDAQVRDVIKYLSKISDINIVFDEGSGAASEVGKALDSRITITLKEVPLEEDLQYILSAKGLKFRIDEYAIVISTSARLEGVEMETRYYYLASGSGSLIPKLKKSGRGEESPAAGEEASTEESGDEEASGVAAPSSVQTIKDVLEQSGVPFPSGSKIFLDKKTGILLVRNTLSNLGVIEKILGALDVSPLQVAIEAKFVDIVETGLRELGLKAFLTGDFPLSKQGGVNDETILASANNSTFGQFTSSGQGLGGLSKGLRVSTSSGSPLGNIFSIAEVLTQPQFQVVLHALEQSGMANVLSSPKVTTINNQQAKIEVVTEIIYPTEYEVTPPTANLAGTLITPGVALPGGFATRNTGVILVVTPSVGADKKAISLNLRPEFSELTGWSNFGVSAGPSSLGSNAIPILQPIFSTRNVSTSVIVNDGETVVLGGLMRESTTTVDDKIPVLGDIPLIGRAFRMQGESATKRNLLIFVTAYVLTPEGEVMREPHYAKTKIFNP